MLSDTRCYGRNLRGARTHTLKWDVKTIRFACHSTPTRERLKGVTTGVFKEVWLGPQVGIAPFFNLFLRHTGTDCIDNMGLPGQCLFETSFPNRKEKYHLPRFSSKYQKYMINNMYVGGADKFPLETFGGTSGHFYLCYFIYLFF